MEREAPVTLEPLSPAAAAALWQAGQQSGDWPFRGQTESLWQTRQIELAAAEILGLACARAVEVDGACVGFCTLQFVDPAHQATPRAVECGTWLMPSARGRGLNRRVKTKLLDFAFSGEVLPTPEWCVFLLLPDNGKARQSLLRISLPWLVEDSRDRRPEQRFHRLLRRRAWETGDPVVAIAIDRISYAAWRADGSITNRSP